MRFNFFKQFRRLREKHDVSRPFGLLGTASLGAALDFHFHYFTLLTCCDNSSCTSVDHQIRGTHALAKRSNDLKCSYFFLNTLHCGRKLHLFDEGNIHGARKTNRLSPVLFVWPPVAIPFRQTRGLLSDPAGADLDNVFFPQSL